MRVLPRGLVLAGLLLVCASSAARTPHEVRELTADGQPPSLHIPLPEIDIDVPMPVNSANLKLLLAQAGNKGDLRSIKDAALRKYHRHLQDELTAQLSAFFTEEEVPLVEKEGLLALRNTLNVRVIKHLSDLKSENGYELERGTVELTGDFSYQLQSFSGELLQEDSLDLSKLRVREKYTVKSPNGGGEVEDDTEQVIKLALSKMVQRILRKIDGDLDADELSDIIEG